MSRMRETQQQEAKKQLPATEPSNKVRGKKRSVHRSGHKK